MRTTRPGDDDHTLAVFVDFENLALGFDGRRERFEIERVLERLVEKGKIVVKRAYCDWSRFPLATTPLHEAAIELIEIPKRSATGKNSADIRLVVDAIDLAYSKHHIDTFVIVSGDSDFSPLVSKLKELGKHVIGLGLTEATSHLLRDNCDEFIYYEDLGKGPALAPALNDNVPEIKRKLFNLLIDSLVALRRENKEVIQASMLKDTMKRKKPSFNEEYYGFRTFSDLLEDAARFGILDIAKGKSSGTYIITRFGTEPRRPEPLLESQTPQEREARRRPRRRRSGSSNGNGNGNGPAIQQGQGQGPRQGQPQQQLSDQDDVVPLGRMALDEIDPFDDEIPSYRPVRPTTPTRQPVKQEQPPRQPARQETPPPLPQQPPPLPRQPARQESPPPLPQQPPPLPAPPKRQAPPPPPPPTVQGPKSGKIPRPVFDDDVFGAGIH